MRAHGNCNVFGAARILVERSLQPSQTDGIALTLWRALYLAWLLTLNLALALLAR